MVEQSKRKKGAAGIRYRGRLAVRQARVRFPSDPLRECGHAHLGNAIIGCASHSITSNVSDGDKIAQLSLQDGTDP
jgi:hypothetical protein